MAERRTIFAPAISRARTEAKELKRADLEQRAGAVNILHPHEVAGDYNAGRALKTTFRGRADYLTQADLSAFRRNVATLGKRFKGGITAAEVIERSLPVDRERANRQIRTAVPAWAKRGQIHFVTNAGPDSDVRRHHVDVIFLAHSVAVATPKKADASLARTEALGDVRIECDCPHWRYRYRYIATIGNFNAGRPENGYPRLTNPNLRGIACKHVLRVMKAIPTGPVLSAIARMIEADRKASPTGVSKAVTLSETQAKQIAAKQHQQAGLVQNRIHSQKEHAALAVARLKATRRGATAHAKSSAPMSPAKLEREKRNVQATLEVLAQRGGISQLQLANALAALQGK